MPFYWDVLRPTSSGLPRTPMSSDRGVIARNRHDRRVTRNPALPQTKVCPELQVGDEDRVAIQHRLKQSCFDFPQLAVGT